MRITISRQRSLKPNRRGLSHIIVVVLSLVVLVVVVSNVILWSYQMNQLDWEKMQENVVISNVVQINDSSWFVTQNEYTMNRGTRRGGSYVDTQQANGNYESFRESSPPRELDINGTFSIDLSSYPLAIIQSVEIQMRYRVDDTGEQWFLKAYNWTSQIYSNSGFNSTSGDTPALGWNTYTVELTNQWRSYVRDDGRILVQVRDEGPDATCTTLDIEFLGVRALINGALFTFQNRGAPTIHVVSIWVNNISAHRRYPADVFVNAGDTFSYQRVDIPLPSGQYTVKAVTARGTIVIYPAG